MHTKIKPPWIKYPDFPPYDGFWRQSGEYWLKDVWEPFWNNLSQKEQDQYLKRWPPPKDWITFYLDTSWLDDIDEK